MFKTSLFCNKLSNFRNCSCLDTSIVQLSLTKNVARQLVVLRAFSVLLLLYLYSLFHAYVNAEWMYVCWVNALITWSLLKFIILRYSSGFQCHVLYKHFTVLFSHGTDSSSLYSTHLTRSVFRVPARGIAYTNITHIVIPLSLCKYTSFPRVKIVYLCNRCTFVRREQSSHNACVISKRDNVSSRESPTT